MDINFIQETIDSLRTLTQLNGALTRLNSQLINDIVKESTLTSAKEEILIAVENVKPEVDLSGVAQETTLQEVKNAVENIDFTPIEEKIDNIDLSSIKGDNPLATNSKILEEVQKVSSLDADILQGKIKIAVAITQKGVPTTQSDSLNSMATKINQIRQMNNTGTSDWDEFSFPEECSYNAYRFTKDLMETELPAKYPSYLKDYLVRYGTNLFWVGEYSFTSSLVLSMADAYYTSDGHFYTLINGVVTHTLPDGTIETYESESVEHNFEWNGNSNILVANIYTSNYVVNNYQNNNLLGVIACGTCLGFSLLTPIYYITSLGEINNVSLYGDGVAKEKLIIRGLKNQGLLINSSSGASIGYKSLILPDLEELNAPLYTTVSNKTISSSICILPNLKVNNSYIINYDNTDLVYLSVGMKKLYNNLFKTSGNAGYHVNKLKEIHLPNLEDMNGYLFNSGENGYFAIDLIRIYTPRLKRLTQGVFHLNPSHGWYRYGEKRSLIDFEVGEVETDMTLQLWTATNVLPDPDKTIQLQNNIHNHIAERVKDVTGEAPLTITFSQAVRDVLLPETEELFAAKNWNIAPAKSV